jgi:hypothetical protein
MSRILAASFLRRLSLSAGASCLLVLALIGIQSLRPIAFSEPGPFSLAAAQVKAELQREAERAPPKTVDLEEGARRLRQELDAEAAARRMRQEGAQAQQTMPPREPDFAGAARQMRQERDAARESQTPTAAEVSNSGVIPQALHFGRTIGQYLPLFVASTISLFVLWDMARRLILEPSVGWRRLSIVVTVATGPAVFGLWIHDGEDFDDSLKAGLIGLCLAFVTILYGRAIFRWVAEGFQGTRQSPRGNSEGVSDVIELERAPPPIQTQPIANLSPSLESPKSSPAKSITWKDSSFWPRFWARCFDLPICWVLGSLLADFLPNYGATFEGSLGVVLDLLTGMAIICLFLFFYEAFFVSKFRGTLGKKLLGLEVRSIDDRYPNWAEALTRARVYLKSGLYFMFLVPVPQIVAAYLAWKRPNKAHPWDTAARTYVRQKPIGIFRRVVVIGIAILLSAGMVASLKLLKEDTQDRIFNSTVENPTQRR